MQKTSKTESVHQVINDLLRHHELLHTVSSDGKHDFVLTDMLTPKGEKSITLGIEEIDHLSECLSDAITPFISASPDTGEAVACPTEYAHPFFVYDFMPQKIMFKSDRGDDTMALDVLSVRGWGHLIGHGQAGLKINEKAAAEIQDNFGKWVAKTLTDTLFTSPVTPSPDFFAKSAKNSDPHPVTPEGGERIKQLEDALRQARDAIVKAAQDALWCDDSMGETIVDRIDFVLGNGDETLELFPADLPKGDDQVALFIKPLAAAVKDDAALLMRVHVLGVGLTKIEGLQGEIRRLQSCLSNSANQSAQPDLSASGGAQGLEWQGQHLFFNSQCVGYVEVSPNGWDSLFLGNTLDFHFTEEDAKAALEHEARSWLSPLPQADTVSEKPPLKMLVDNEWLKGKILTDPDCDVEARSESDTVAVSREDAEALAYASKCLAEHGEYKPLGFNFSDIARRLRASMEGK